MKIRSALRRICDKCEIVRRHRTLFVICGRNPKHKQRQGVSTVSPAAAAAACDSCFTTSSLTATSAPVFPSLAHGYALTAPLPTWASSFQPVNMARSSTSKMFAKTSLWNGSL